MTTSPIGDTPVLIFNVCLFLSLVSLIFFGIRIALGKPNFKQTLISGLLVVVFFSLSLMAKEKVKHLNSEFIGIVKDFKVTDNSIGDNSVVTVELQTGEKFTMKFKPQIAVGDSIFAYKGERFNRPK